MQHHDATRAETEHALLRYVDGCTTRAGSKPASADCLPTSTRTPTIAPSTTPTDNPDSGKAGEAHMLRLSVGCEHVEDLWADLTIAFDAAVAPCHRSERRPRRHP